MMPIMTGCVKTVTETQIKYIPIEIPSALVEPCEDIQFTATTNGELLMSYISLQTAYMICSSKVSSISNILEIYKSNYNTSTENTQ